MVHQAERSRSGGERGRGSHSTSHSIQLPLTPLVLFDFTFYFLTLHLNPSIMPGSESHTDTRRRPSSDSITESILRIWREKCVLTSLPYLSIYISIPKLTCNKQPYAADYIGLAIITPIWICLQLFIFTEPFHRMFALDDRRIQYPHAEIEHVPVTWLLIYAGLFPFLILLVWSFAFFKNQHKTHVTLLGFGISLLVTLFVTDVCIPPWTFPTTSTKHPLHTGHQKRSGQTPSRPPLPLPTRSRNPLSRTSPLHRLHKPKPPRPPRRLAFLPLRPQFLCLLRLRLPLLFPNLSISHPPP
jgi:hypothetical protein